MQKSNLGEKKQRKQSKTEQNAPNIYPKTIDLLKTQNHTPNSISFSNGFGLQNQQTNDTEAHPKSHSESDSIFFYQFC